MEKQKQKKSTDEETRNGRNPHLFISLPTFLFSSEEKRGKAPIRRSSFQLSIYVCMVQVKVVVKSTTYSILNTQYSILNSQFSTLSQIYLSTLPYLTYPSLPVRSHPYLLLTLGTSFPSAILPSYLFFALSKLSRLNHLPTFPASPPPRLVATNTGHIYSTALPTRADHRSTRTAT